jgi:guanine deaminase
VPARRHRLVVLGTVLQAPGPQALEVLADVAVVVGHDGRIADVFGGDTVEAADACRDAERVERLTAAERLLPGLVDLHVHAPQWPQLGTGLDLPLERWLFEHTFPLEARYRDPAFAAAVWEQMVPCLLAHGTTTAVYFSSIHEEATGLLADACAGHGQRAFVGRVAMDHPEGTPDWYRDRDAGAGVDASARSVERVRAVGGDLVQPILTPRFVPACTDELLLGLGDLAAETGVRVQTHCSESDWEHHHVLQRCGRRDTEVLGAVGLLRAGTVLAHGNHLDDGDFGLIRGAGGGVAHCPLSNAYFAGAVFPLRRALDLGVRVGLGTDVAGGSHPGLLPQCTMAVTASRMLRDGVDPGRSAATRGVADAAVDTVAAFHLATAGGAAVLGIPAGLLAPGHWFDAIAVRLDRPGSPLRLWDELDDEARVLEKVVRLAGPADLRAVWVGGRLVAGTDRAGLPGDVPAG